MNSFITYLARGDHSLQLAAHLAAGILSLLLLSGAARPNATASSDRVADARGSASTLVAVHAPGH